MNQVLRFSPATRYTFQPPFTRKEPWNGRDFYTNFGHGPRRSWEDGRKYGFIAAGGSPWYSRVLFNLFKGARIFTQVPGDGYVGVGIVAGDPVPVVDATVEVDGKRVPLLEAPLAVDDPDHAYHHDRSEEDMDYIVPVTWIKAVPIEDAYRFKGQFGIQLSACKLRSQFTIDQVLKHFGIENVEE